MLNFQPQRIDDLALRGNQSAIERHVDDDHYVREFTPGEFVLGGAAVPVFAAIPAANLRWPAIEMPDGGTSTATASWRKPSEWRIGHLRITYWYTSPVGSTNNFYIQLNVDAAKGGEVLPATNLLGLAGAVAGPAVANTLIKSAQVYTTTPLGSDDELFSIRVTRIGADASDTNVNVFQLVHVVVEHIPAVQVSQ